MKKLLILLVVLLFVVAIGCSSNSVTGPDQQSKQTTLHKDPAPVSQGDPDDIIDGNKDPG